MKTILDSAYSFYLDGILYRGGGSLQIILIEASVKQEEVEVPITEDINLKCYPVEPTENSRRFTINFKHPVVWQVVEDDSLYGSDEDEVTDSLGTLQVIQNSKYFEYVKKNHGWYEYALGPGMHYRIATENEVIDVVSCDEPDIEELMAEK